MVKKIRYVFFDLDDTLFPTSVFAELARKNAINAMIQQGLKSDPDTAYRELLAIIKEMGSNYPLHFNILCERFNKKVESRIVAAGVIAYHNTKTTILPFTNTYLTLVKLRESGYKIYIATNGSPLKQWEKILRLKIDYFFDDVFISEEQGLEKSREFFEYILKQKGLDPEECIMIGNSLDVDVFPALASGMDAMLVDHYKRFQKLKEHSVREEGKKYFICKLNRPELYELGFCKLEGECPSSVCYSIVEELLYILDYLEIL